jgi:hypothetical protein
MIGPYINDPGYEIPQDKIVIVPHSLDGDGRWKDVIKPLLGEMKRDWFTPHFYYCLPLNIGNQHGFVIRSLRDFDIIWDGTHNDAVITFLNQDNEGKQFIMGGFSQGIVTVQNSFSLKTPIGVNLMTIQPPNMFLPACVAMTGVIETDQIRRDFTFNFKITVPNLKIEVRKGDPLGAFIPIPRNFINSFTLDVVDNMFDKSLHENELNEQSALSVERSTVDKLKPHESGRRYFNGVHTDGSTYFDHQKRLLDN